MPKIMLLGKDKTIPMLAMVVLLIGTASALYVEATKVEKETISLNDFEFSIEEIFDIIQIITIETDEGEKTGVSLEKLIIHSGITCPSCHEYTIKAVDKYQQTVSWEILKTGVLTKNKRVFFPDTAHAFWVREVIEIEVN